MILSGSSFVSCIIMATRIIGLFSCSQFKSHSLDNQEILGKYLSVMF